MKNVVTLRMHEVVRLGLATKYFFTLPGQEFSADPQFGTVSEVGMAQYQLPDGYTIGETQSDEPCIVDPDGMICDMSADHRTPVIISAAGERYLRNLGALVLEDAYVPILGRCDVHAGYINLEDDGSYKKKFYLTPLNFERKGNDGAVYTISNVWLTVDYDKQKAMIKFRKLWIGGLVEEDTIVFNFKTSLTKNKNEEITRVVLSPVDDAVSWRSREI